MTTSSEEDGRFLRLVIHADLAQVAKARDALALFAGRGGGLSESRLFDLQVVASEAVANGIEHAAGEVLVRAWMLHDRLVVEVQNDGPFRPGLYKDGTGRRRGLGLPLMVSLADNVHVDRREESKTIVSFSFLYEGVSNAAPDGFDGVPATTVRELAAETAKLKISLSRERALQKTEERVRSSLKNAPITIATQDLDLRYTWAYNQRANRPEDIIGKTDKDLFPDQAEALMAIQRDVIESGVERHEQSWVSGPGGRTYLDLHYDPMLDQSGGIVGILVTAIDLTALKQAEEQLCEREAVLCAIQDSAEDSIWLFDADGTVLAVNKTATRRLQKKPEELIGDNLTNIGSPEIAERRWQLLREVVESGRPIEFKDEPAGRTFAHRFYPVVDDEGRVKQVTSFSRDITEREEAERELDRRARLLDISSEAIFAWELDGPIVYWNAGAEALYGFTAGEAVERVSHDLLKAAYPGGLQAFRARLERDGEWMGEVTHTTNTGEAVTVESRRQLVDARGRLVVLETNRDVSERKRSEQIAARAGRTLRALSDSNQALVRARTEAEFLQEACRIIVEHCGYQMVWIGYAENDESKRIIPVASAGFEVGYLETLELTWSDTERGRGPTGTAVRERITVGCPDMLTDARFSPWRDEAVKRGYRSSMAVPICGSGEAIGAVTMYSAQADAFSEEEVQLLVELAGDLAVGIETLRLRSEHAAVESERERLLVLEQDLAEQLAAANEELRAQNEELAAAEDKVRFQHEELLAQHYELEETYRLSQALNALGSRMSASLNFREILHQVLVGGAEALGADTAVLELVNDGRWTVEEVIGLDAELEGFTLGSAGVALESEAVAERTPLIVHADQNRNAVQMLARLAAESALVLPLVARGSAVGAAIFGHAEGPGHFTDRHLEFAESVSLAAGMALTNSRLYSDIQSSADKQALEARLSESLSEIGTLAAFRPEQDHILRTLVRQAMHAADADSARLFRRDADRWVLHCVGGDQLPSGVLESESIDQACVEWVLREKRPLVRSHELVDESGSGSVFTVLAPLTVRGGIVWLLDLGYRKKPKFASSHEDWASRLSFKMSLVLENAALYQNQRSTLRQLEQALLSYPQSLPGVEVGHAYQAAGADTGIGGDFYDVYGLSDDRVAIVIGDVCGKGIDAAMLAALIRNGLRAFLSDSEDVSSAVAKLNLLLLRNSPRTSFATLFCGVLDPGDGEMRYISAGHPPSLVWREATGGVNELMLTSPVIGVFPDATFAEERTSLAVGDKLLLYTDGIMEARRDGEIFGETGLARFLAAEHAAPTEEVASKLIQEAILFAGEATRDDMAALSISMRQ